MLPPTNAQAPNEICQPEPTGHTGAQALVETLASAGVTHVFGIPGEHCLAITDAIDRHNAVEFVSTRHESSAAFMAEAHGKLTGRPAACLGTASVGASNLVAGVNVAHHDSTPMLVLVGQVATRLRGRGAWQEIDLVSMFTPICRYAAEVSHSETLTEVTSRAISLSTANRPGPVMVSVPVDIQESPSPITRANLAKTRDPAPSVRDLREVVRLLKASRRPLIVVGGGIRASGAREDLVRLAQDINLPVVTGFRRTDAFPNDSVHYIGTLGLSASDTVRTAVLSADLLLAVGTRLSELTTLHYAYPTAIQRVVHIDSDAETFAAQSSPAIVSLVSGAKHALRGLYEECTFAGLRMPERWWECYRDMRGEESTVGMPLDARKRAIRHIATEINDLLPAECIVTSDAGDFFLDCAPMIKFNGQRRFLGPTSGSMGYGLPAAIGAQSTAPDIVCVALCGDGGAMMSIQELETAVRSGLHVVVVVFNNFAYGSIARHQNERFSGNLVGANLGNPSFARLADLFGATGFLVTSPHEFTDAFASALASTGVAVVEVQL